MANEFFTILTAAGRNKLAAATATATPLALTQMAVGDGDPATPGGAYYSPTEAQTALKNEVWRGAINHLAVDANNPNWIVAELVIPDDVGGFYIREVGLFDSAGAMIAVGKFPESYKPTLAAGSNKQLYVRMILEVSNTTAVTLLVDPSVVLATRQYVDDKVSIEINKLDGKQSVRVATTGAIALTGLQTIDGVVLAAGDRVLVKDQAAGAENGIYVVGAAAWARASDADAAIEVTPGLFAAVEQGTANADSVWALVTDVPIILGTTSLSFDWVARRGLASLAEMNVALADKVSRAAIQGQTYTAFTSAGAAPNFTLTPSPAIAAYAAGQRFRVKFHAAGAGADVLNVSALGNKSLKQYDSTGFKVAAAIAANQLADIEYDGVDMVILDPLPQSVATSTNDASFADNGAKPASTSWVRGAMSAIAMAAGFSVSLSSNGYVKFPSWLGGVIIQWGAGTTPGGTGGITFPIAFPNNAFRIVAIENSASGWSTSNLSVYGRSAISTTGATIRSLAWTGGAFALGSGNFDWIAVGN